MPKVEIDYSNTIIYKIVCKDPLIKDVYVGHTTNFVQRKHAHKCTCNNIKSPCYNLKLYKTIRDNGNWANWDMVIVNFYKCKNLFEAKQKEQEHFIALNATLNSVEPLQQSNNSIEPKFYKPSGPKFYKPSDQIDDTDITPKNKFICDPCNFKCIKQSNYTTHLSTPKHTTTSGKFKHLFETLNCDCGNTYKHRQSLYNHKKKCLIHSEEVKNVNAKIEIIPEIEKKQIPSILGLSEEFIMKLINQNNDMQKLILEQNTKMTDQNTKIIELISHYNKGNKEGK
jgi:hypothetical protein